MRTTTCKHARGCTTLLAVVALAIIAPGASAQESPVPGAASPSGWLVGGALGLPGGGTDVEPSFFTIGFHATQFRPLRPGLDLAAGFAPRLIELGGVGARIGVTVPVPVGQNGGLTLLPMGGVSAIAALAEGGAAARGFTVGGSALFGTRGSSGTRVGISFHWFGSEPVWLLEAGFAVLRPRRQADDAANAREAAR